MLEFLFYPVTAFLIFLIIIYLFYVFAGRLGPALKPEKYKQDSYACGEEHPDTTVKQSYDFFHVAFFFTILHVGALFIATAPSGESALLGVVLISAMALTAFALYVGGRNHA